MLVLVTGATGNVGSGAVRELAGQGESVRAFVRSAPRARAQLGRDIELAVGSLMDRASLADAMSGVNAVLISTSDTPDKVHQESMVAEVAAEQGVSRVVKISVNGAAADSPVGIWRWHAGAEEAVRRAVPTAVVLRANFFLTNLLQLADGITDAGCIFAPAGDALVAMVDPADVGAAAAIVLARNDGEAGDDGRTYQLTGPESVGFAAVAEAISAAIQRPVGYVPIADDAAIAGLVDSGLPAAFADDMVAVFGQLRSGIAATTSAHLADLLGHAPTTMTDFVLRHASVFAGQPAKYLAPTTTR